jgi:16S rRNA processing protein RimM
LGLVRDLLSTGPQTVLVIDDIQEAQTVERMIPFVAAYIDDVNLTERRILVDWQPDY